MHKHRTLWLSDLHLGSPGCKARQLTEFLRGNDCERLYLVGDIFDGWKMKNRFYWTADHTRVIKAILAKARRGTEVIYLTGNHDGFIRLFVRSRLKLGRIKITHEVVHTTANGRRLLVQHGDRYDGVVSSMPRLAIAGDIAYEALLRASGWLEPLGARLGLPAGWTVSSLAKYCVKSVVQVLSGFDEAVYYTCRRRDLHGVVCGHTHHAEARHVRNGIMSYNCGDWVESMTALAEDASGHVRVIRGHRAKPAVAPSRHRPTRALDAAA